MKFDLCAIFSLLNQEKNTIWPKKQFFGGFSQNRIFPYFI